MNAAALISIRVPDDSITNLTALNLAWPNNVPSTETSITLMYAPRRLPEVLHAPTLELLTTFTERNLSFPPEGIGVEEWLKALAITWRLKAAAALAKQARNHDEKGLQRLFDEAAETREWLLKLANAPGFGGQLEAQALRGLLQSAWGEVLDNAPAAPTAAPQRPQARTGHTGIHRGMIRPGPAPKPKARAVTKPAFEPLAPVAKVRGKLVFAMLVASIAARVFLVEGDLKAPVQSGATAQSAKASAPP